MPRYLAKTFVIIFAVSAALTCDAAVAAMATVEAAASEHNTRSLAVANPSHRIDTFLPDAAIRVAQTPFAGYQGRQTSRVIDNQETVNSASPPTPALLLRPETRPTTSLMFGWLPPKDDMKTTGLYQPGSYQYVSTETERGCGTADKAAGNAAETPEGGSKGLHLPSGWLLGMCLHY